MTRETRLIVHRLASLRGWLFALAGTLPLAIPAVQPVSAQTEKVLYSFKNGPDGVYPSAGVVRDAAGNLYGTTTYGGAHGLGTVFKFSKRGKTVLYSFSGKDGANPDGLTRDAAGNLYGITLAGGDLTCPYTKGCGVVFKLDASGREAVLHRFTGSTADGAIPTGLILDATGNLYGTTELAGANNVGMLFKIDKTGKESVVYSFTGGTVGTDGAIPNSVITDGAGNLFGTTSGGGLGNAGTVFKVDPTGKETVLYRFTGGNGGTDGKTPAGGLVMDIAGNIYGTTLAGGTTGLGTIFKVDPAGNETVLHSFGNPGDGAYPQALALDSAGNLYGNTIFGGTSDAGTVFKYDSAGNETIVHSFSGTDGLYPQGDLSLNQTGGGIIIYGTTQQGGAFGWGTVFDIAP